VLQQEVLRELKVRQKEANQFIYYTKSSKIMIEIAAFYC
jgi:hypothetical protein